MRPGCRLAEAPRSLIRPREATRSGRLASAASPRLVSAGVPALANGPSAFVIPVRLGAPAQVGGNRRRGVGEAAQLNHRQLQLLERVRELDEALLDVVAALGCGLAGGRRVVDEAGDVVALAGERRQHRVGVDGELGEALVLLGEDREHPVGLLEGGVGALDHFAERLAAGGEAGAEVVEDEPELVGLGLLVDVVDEVDVDGLAVVVDRQEVLALAGLAVSDDAERGRRLAGGGARLRRLAVDELLTEQRLRADDAAGVRAAVLEAGVADVHHDDRLAGIVVAVRVDGLAGPGDVDGVDRADGGAGDPHLLVVDEEAGVVEVAADHVAVRRPAVALGAGGQERRGEDARDQGRDECEAPHGPPVAGQRGHTRRCRGCHRRGTGWRGRQTAACRHPGSDGRCRSRRAGTGARAASRSGRDAARRRRSSSCPGRGTPRRSSRPASPGRNGRWRRSRTRSRRASRGSRRHPACTAGRRRGCPARRSSP